MVGWESLAVGDWVPPPRRPHRHRGSKWGQAWGTPCGPKPPRHVLGTQLEDGGGHWLTPSRALTCAGFSHFLRKSSLALAKNSFTARKRERVRERLDLVKVGPGYSWGNAHLCKVGCSCLNPETDLFPVASSALLGLEGSFEGGPDVGWGRGPLYSEKWDPTSTSSQMGYKVTRGLLLGVQRVAHRPAHPHSPQF